MTLIRLPALAFAALVLLATCAVVGIAPLRAQAPITGCWRVDRPLGPTGGVEPVARDAAFTTFVLQDSGRVALPLLSERERRMWEGRSHWSATPDTVTLVSFTGLQGWKARLAQGADRRLMRGTATYLTDVLVAGATALIVPIRMTRIACLAEWPPTTTSSPALRPWQRGEQPFFADQVDQPATVVAASIPKDVMAVRALRFDERTALDAADARDGIARVLLQCVVEADGRARVLSVKVLASDGEAYAAQAKSALDRLRFSPGLRKGVAVHQLALLRFELRRQ